MIKALAPLVKATAGFAREELILAAAVGGALTTFGVAGAINMGWVGSGGTSGVKIADALQSIESANLKFYQMYGMWPDEVSDGTPAGNVAILVSNRADANGALRGRPYRAFIQADMDMTDQGLAVRYRPAGGAVIGQTSLSEGSSYRYMVGMENLSLEQARQIDEKIDGVFGPDKGQLRISYADNGKQADIKYYVNPRTSDVATQ